MKKIALFLIAFAGISPAFAQNTPQDHSISGLWHVSTPSSTPGGVNGAGIYPGGTMTIHFKYYIGLTDWQFDGTDGMNDAFLIFTLSKLQGSATNLPVVTNSAGIVQDMFTWFYDANTNSYYGFTKNYLMAGMTANTITVSNLPISAASSMSQNDVGFGPNLTTPAATSWGNLPNDGANHFTYTQPPSVLPVLLTSFTAQAQDCKAVLNWSSGAEKNFSYYGVEKSTDGKRFEAAGRVNAKGANSKYTFTDNTPDNVTYYRLNMTDKDGSNDYSDIRSVKIDCDAADLLPAIAYAPNPTNGKVMITGLTGGHEVVVYNSLGQEALRCKAESTRMDVDLSAYASGIYIFVVRNGQQLIQKTRIIKK